MEAEVGGETDLVELLSGLRPELSGIEFGFATLPPNARPPAGLQPTGTFQEAEGLTLIAPTRDLVAAGLTFSGCWARITLNVYSSLEAVGMIAAVAAALAREGISTNPVAGYFHDHLFVPWERRQDALSALRQLSGAEDMERGSVLHAGLVVRRAHFRDVDALVPLFDAYRVFYEQQSDPALARAFLAERLAAGDSVIYLADRDGLAGGFTQLYPSFSSTRARRIYILNDLFVAPDFRRSGASKALLEAAATFARTHGALRLTLATAHSNAAAQALYEASGWVRDDHFLTYNLAL